MILVLFRVPLKSFFFLDFSLNLLLRSVLDLVRAPLILPNKRTFSYLASHQYDKVFLYVLVFSRVSHGRNLGRNAFSVSRDFPPWLVSLFR